MEHAFAPDQSSELNGLLRTNKLTNEALVAFFTGQFTCLMITDAIDQSAARHISHCIISSERLEGYKVEQRFLKIGKAWFDNATDQERTEHISKTSEYTRETRALCAPFPVPTDIVKLDLDLIWRVGVFNLRIDGHPIYCGLPRALPPGGAVEAHFDWIGFDSPGSRGIEDIQHQIAVNFYLQTPESGGELALWDTGMSPAQLQALRRPDHEYALDEAKLGRPTLVVKPEERSLVFFNACQPHAVREAKGSLPRVTFSSFIGYSGPDRPLKL